MEFNNVGLISTLQTEPSGVYVNILFYCRVLPYPEDPYKESNGEESTEEADDDVSHLQDPRPFKLSLGGRLQKKLKIQSSKASVTSIMVNECSQRIRSSGS